MDTLLHRNDKKLKIDNTKLENNGKLDLDSDDVYPPQYNSVSIEEFEVGYVYMYAYVCMYIYVCVYLFKCVLYICMHIFVKYLYNCIDIFSFIITHVLIFDEYICM
jgi:hypothetical protein